MLSSRHAPPTSPFTPTCVLHPVLLFCSGARQRWGSLPHRQKHKKTGLKVTKKQTECILFLGPAAMLSHSQVSESTLTCFFLCVRVPDGWPDIIFDSHQVADCSVKTQCNVIPALLFVLLMYLESPTLGAAIIVIIFLSVCESCLSASGWGRTEQEGAGPVCCCYLNCSLGALTQNIKEDRVITAQIFSHN